MIPRKYAITSATACRSIIAARLRKPTLPGTSSSVKGGWLHDGHNDAINLSEQANAADPNNPTAVIAWMGYDAPNDLAVAEPNMARNGTNPDGTNRDRDDMLPRRIYGDESMAPIGGKMRLTPEFLCWLMGFPPVWLKPLRDALETPSAPKR